MALRVPQAGIDLRALHAIRAELGDGAFLPAVRAVLNAESTTNLLGLLDQISDEQ
ncbi:MAG TPA: hypothetical protein VLJ59_05860 [Mycobacteriales bacterium]|nr:hypothetical protein [Mycobacteriales bacterium]